MKTLKKKITVPIYEADVWLFVADDIHAERTKVKNIFGEPPAKDSYGALASYDGVGNFGMFFESRKFTICKLAHEVFHLTHRILEWTNSNFDSGHHEQAAMLCGYLMEWAMKETEQFRKINRKRKETKP